MANTHRQFICGEREELGWGGWVRGERSPMTLRGRTFASGMIARKETAGGGRGE